jgi:hypothetical protein
MYKDSYSVGIGGNLPGGKAAGTWSWPLPLHLEPKLRMSGVIPPVPITHLLNEQGQLLYTRINNAGMYLFIIQPFYIRLSYRYVILVHTFQGQIPVLMSRVTVPRLKSSSSLTQWSAAIIQKLIAVQLDNNCPHFINTNIHYRVHRRWQLDPTWTTWMN